MTVFRGKLYMEKALALFSVNYGESECDIYGIVEREGGREEESR